MVHNGETLVKHFRGIAVTIATQQGGILVLHTSNLSLGMCCGRYAAYEVKPKTFGDRMSQDELVSRTDMVEGGLVTLIRVRL